MKLYQRFCVSVFLYIADTSVHALVDAIDALNSEAALLLLSQTSSGEISNFALMKYICVVTQ